MSKTIKEKDMELANVLENSKADIKKKDE